MVTFVPSFVNPEAAAWRAEGTAQAAAQGITPADADEYGAFLTAYRASHSRAAGDPG